MNTPWFEPWIWADFRVAVLFTVLIPLALLLWAAIAKAEAVQQLLVVYWRVASLLAITVYLMIGSFPISFVTAIASRILIPLGLWYWVDLNEELEELRQPKLKFVVKAWRFAITAYCAVGAVANLLSLPCAAKNAAAIAEDSLCRAWLAPTWLYREYFHANTNPSFLGFLGILGLVIYVLYLGTFVAFRLPKQGRLAQR